MSTLPLVDRRFDARQVLERLIGKTIRTLTGRPNKVLGIEGHEVRVATSRSPKGTLVPIAWVQEALDRLASDGEIEISVESVGYRSAFVGAVLCSLDETECSPTTMRVRLVDP
jgi:hypothetical protein